MVISATESEASLFGLKCGKISVDVVLVTLFICNRNPKSSSTLYVFIINIARFRRLRAGRNMCDYTSVFLCTGQKRETNFLCPVKCFPHAVFMLLILIVDSIHKRPVFRVWVYKKTTLHFIFFAFSFWLLVI